MKRFFADKEQCSIFAILFQGKVFKCKTGYGAVRLAHLLWEQGVAGSNPATPTETFEKTKTDSVKHPERWVSG